MSPSCPNTLLWQRLAAGQLSVEETAQLQQHLRSCPLCATRVEQESYTDPLPPPPSPVPTLAAFAGVLATTPSSTAAGDKDSVLPQRIGRYPIHSLIGRGGMGVVYRGLDPSLQRPLAVKVLLAEHAGDASLKQRFLQEAQIMGQLQHPGVPPIHEIGLLADGRPFFSMKEIQGQTLAGILKQRRNPGDDLAAHVGIFAQVCQTLAYAHARRVIHRDLKPANIMVGAFGEVQVMDWGLAKILSQTDAESPKPADAATVPGTMLGTPAYMAPEQARGETDRVDEGSDVFGLGAMLCEILTGEPPYRGRSVVETLAQAALLSPNDAQQRLGRCGADRELVALCRRCLTPERERRPARAGEVAEAVARYQTKVQERLRQAEVARASAQIKAREERKRRRAMVALLVVALGSVLAGSAGALWYLDDQARRTEAEIQNQADKARLQAEAAQLQADRVLRQAEAAHRHRQVNKEIAAALDDAARPLREIGQHLADPVTTSVLLSDPERQWKGRLDQAAMAWQKAAAVAATNPEGLEPGLKKRLDELAGELTGARRDWERARELDDIRQAASSVLVGGNFGFVQAGPRYTAAFARWGLAVDAHTPRQLADQLVQDRLRYALVAALDHWAEILPSDDAALPTLLAAARLADPDPWRDQVRSKDLWGDAARLEKLAAEIQPRRHSPQVILVLAWALPSEPRARLLRRALLDHPRDFWLHMKLGYAVKDAGEQAGCFRAALAVRPDNVLALLNLGLSLREQHDTDNAIAVFRRALEVDPKAALVHYNLGVALDAKGDLEGALAAYRTAVASNPKDPWYHNNLGACLEKKGDLDGAAEAYRKAVECDPKYRLAYCNLGGILRTKGDLDGAAGAFAKAVDCDPKHPDGHIGLGRALQAKGDVDGAVAAYRNAIEKGVHHAELYFNLGVALRATGDLPGAIVAYRDAVAVNPKHVNGHYNLGVVLDTVGDLDGALAAFRKAAELDPKDAWTQTYLGICLRNKGDAAGAVAACRKAADCDPKYGLAPWNLGLALRDQGELKEAVAALERALELLPGNAALQANLRQCRRWVDLVKRLPAIADGSDKPANEAEAVEIAELCRQPFHKRYGLALGLYKGAFAKDAKLEPRHRVAAACAALQLATGADPTTTVRGRQAADLRQEALAWMTAELAAVRKDAKADPAAARDRLAEWKWNPGLASVRAAALTDMAGDERPAWRDFWGEVDQLLTALCSPATKKN